MQEYNIPTFKSVVVAANLSSTSTQSAKNSFILASADKKVSAGKHEGHGEMKSGDHKHHGKCNMSKMDGDYKAHDDTKTHY